MPTPITLKPEERQALQQLASRWWRGPDDGRPAIVELSLLVPAKRTNGELLDLIVEIVEELSAGYAAKITVTANGTSHGYTDSGASEPGTSDPLSDK